MDELIHKINKLKESEIRDKIDSRIKEFKQKNKKSNDELFSEMCFCLLTANFNAERSIEIQNNVRECFLTHSKEEITKKLKEYGHRFPNKRAEYIHKSKECKDNLKNVISFHDREKIREWLVKNVKGLGYKEVSHFLRNIGLDDYAIIDFHIIDILVRHNIIEKPKTLTKNKYLEIEEKLRKLGKKTDLTLGELDLYLWYMETGKILK